MAIYIPTYIPNIYDNDNIYFGNIYYIYIYTAVYNVIWCVRDYNSSESILIGNESDRSIHVKVFYLFYVIREVR